MSMEPSITIRLRDADLTMQVREESPEMQVIDNEAKIRTEGLSVNYTVDAEAMTFDEIDAAIGWK